MAVSTARVGSSFQQHPDHLSVVSWAAMPSAVTPWLQARPVWVSQPSSKQAAAWMCQEAKRRAERCSLSTASTWALCCSSCTDCPTSRKGAVQCTSGCLSPQGWPWALAAALPALGAPPAPAGTAGSALSIRQVGVGPVVQQQQLSGGHAGQQWSGQCGPRGCSSPGTLQQQGQAGAVAVPCSQVQQAPAPCVIVLLVQPPGQQCLCYGCAALHCCHSLRCLPLGVHAVHGCPPEEQGADHCRVAHGGSHQQCAQPHSPRPLGCWPPAAAPPF